MAVGLGPYQIVYSSDGLTWTAVTENPFGVDGYGNGVAGNPNIGPVIVDSQIVLNTNYNLSNRLDIVSDSYYNQGFTNFSLTIKAQEL